MENEPKPEQNNRREEGVPFSEQMNLAKEMIANADEREQWARNKGEGDQENFFAAAQYGIPGARDTYEKLHAEFEKYREAFDTTVPDKKAFVKKLRSMNEAELADAVASMFEVKEGFFGKLFKK